MQSKRYWSWTRWNSVKTKSYDIKTFCNLLPNFIKVLNKSWLKYFPFCKTKVNEINSGVHLCSKNPLSTNQDTFNRLFADSLAKYDRIFLVFSSARWYFTIFKKTEPNLTKFNNKNLWFHPILLTFAFAFDDFKS